MGISLKQGWAVWLALVVLAAGCSAPNGEPTPSQNQRIDSVLNSLSLAQKVGQMTQLNIELFLQKEHGALKDPLQLDSNALQDALQERGVGSIMNFGGRPFTVVEWRYVTETIRYYSSKDGGIPALYAFDAVHGANYVSQSTLFPHQLAMAATWNDSLVHSAARATALETRMAGIDWIFSPILDVARQPLWVQFFETYGEDPYLGSRMAKVAVSGYQDGPFSVAATGKHFLGYGDPRSGKDRTPVLLGERSLRENHLPPFQAAVDQGLATLMIGSNEIDGIPMLGSSYWTNDVLRQELGFDGVIISDWGDIAHLVDWHKVAADHSAAIELAMDAGLDVAMVPNDYTFTDLLVSLVEEGRISEARIDESVRRILILKERQGLFDAHAYPDSTNVRKAHSELAYKSAIEAITLLKNDDEVLPLKENQHVMLCGPGANSQIYLNGSWSRTWQGTDSIIENEGKATLFRALEAKASVSLAETVEEIQAQGKEADVIVLAVGERPSTEKPGDIRDLRLSSEQRTMAEEALSLSKPVVLVLLTDRPRVLDDLVGRCNAIVMGYRPGNEGGRAIADLLMGKRNFSGKLPFTYPGAVNDLLTYDHKHIETIGTDWGPSGFQPAFEFGHGLSYAEFNFSDLNTDAEKYRRSDTVHISLSVTNTGSVAGKEVVMLLASDEVASVTPAVKRLRDFQKIELAVGEARTVEFHLPIEALSFIGENMESTIEAGWFTFKVGSQETRIEVVE